MVTMCDKTVRNTREPEMGYICVMHGMWRFVSLQNVVNNQVSGGACVGPYYASKAELLADSERYLKEWGY
jgi:hypothetical protein